MTADPYDFPFDEPPPEPDWFAPPAATNTDNPRGFIDWQQFWTNERPEPQYVIPDVLPEGNAAAVFARGGVGKSLLALDWAANLATGGTVLGVPVETPRDVLYVDLEQDPDLLRERLQSLGFTAFTDLSRLHYSILGDWPPLDTPDGGQALLDEVNRLSATLVILDTTARTISGNENDADTFHALDRHTIRRLKRQRVASIRLDHAGKDATKGQRGSSAKNDDVDMVYRLEEVTPTRLNLIREKNRLHLPGDDLIPLLRQSGPLRHIRTDADTGRELRIGKLIALLDAAGVPVDAGRQAMRQALQVHGEKARNELLAEVAERRRNLPRPGVPSPVPPYRGGTGGTGDADMHGDSRGQSGDSRGQSGDKTVHGTGKTGRGQVGDSEQPTFEGPF